MDDKILRVIKGEFSELHKNLGTHEIKTETLRYGECSSKQFYDDDIVCLFEKLEKSLIAKLRLLTNE